LLSSGHDDKHDDNWELMTIKKPTVTVLAAAWQVDKLDTHRAFMPAAVVVDIYQIQKPGGYQ
jgi:hypothetical protein